MPAKKKLTPANPDEDLWDEGRPLPVFKVKEGTGKVRGRFRELNKAVNSLPPNAAAKTEQDWVAAHDAMRRKALQDPKDDSPIKLTVDDILYSENGPAPSRSAVNLLQHYVNRPEEYFKKVLESAQKKQAEEEKSGTKAEDDLAEVERLLASVKAPETK